ncbi:MAG: TRAP transporter large permease subunit [Dehalococcoidia bacterium]|nr:TRAP transporter large permease subunit [Dehalococcoidia bacterium]
MMEAGLITPPMGLNVYTIAEVAKDTPVEEIFRGALPFLISIVVIVAIINCLTPDCALSSWENARWLTSKTAWL